MNGARALAAGLVVLMLLPASASAQSEYFAQLVDLPTAHTLPKSAYSAQLRVVPGGGVIAGARVGVADYFSLGLSYSAGNIIGNGDPDWNDSVEIEVKLRLGEENEAVPAVAIGFDSRGYGLELKEGGYEKASIGFFAVATKTLPFSEYWQAHVGLGRTVELSKAKPDIYGGVTARFSQEFSIVAEYHLGIDRVNDGGDGKTGFLNAGLRWVFMDQLQIDFLFKNLVGPSDSPELSSRSIGFVFYDMF